MSTEFIKELNSIGSCVPNPKVYRFGSEPPQMPHKCVVCDGIGKVAYNPENPFLVKSPGVCWPCHACQGTGVLWG